MRFPARPSVLLATLLLLALPALAAAEPKPIAKPSNIAPIQPTKSPVQPSSPPAAPPAPPSAPPASTTPPSGTTGQTSVSGTGSTGTTTPASGTNTPAKETVVVVTAQGGRDQSGIALPAPPPPEPTPLGLVAAGDRATSPSTSTPAWKIALLALLAAAEAFLVVRLVRNRPGDLSPAS